MKLLVKQTDMFGDFKKYGLPTYAVSYGGLEVCKISDDVIATGCSLSYYYRGFFSEIEINSLNELLELTKKWNEEIIICECNKYDVYCCDELHYEYVIEIYNSYRE